MKNLYKNVSTYLTMVQNALFHQDNLIDTASTGLANVATHPPVS